MNQRSSSTSSARRVKSSSAEGSASGECLRRRRVLFGRCDAGLASSSLELKTIAAVALRFLATGPGCSSSLAFGLLIRGDCFFVGILGLRVSSVPLKLSATLELVSGTGASLIAEMSSEEESVTAFFLFTLESARVLFGDLTGEDEN